MFVNDTDKGDQLLRRPHDLALIQKRSGVKRLGSHLVHSYAQNMARKGAPVADIQDVLGHESDKMARHYAGEARKFATADLMAKCSLAS
ncbi:MAG TPA: tyrosine-type recombinase/integrase [Chloroflexota bacterium]